MPAALTSASPNGSAPPNCKTGCATTKPRLSTSCNKPSPRWQSSLKLCRPASCLQANPTPCALRPAPVAQIERCDRQRLFRLPQQSNPAEQRDLLRRHLFQAADAILLPKLAAHSQRLQLIPAAISLTRAKTFWGVCRARTGIKLNWRLICAPSNVQDYVCIHELCHLRHPNHSRAFWQLVQRHSPQSPAAQAWLKQHGKTLFSLG